MSEEISLSISETNKLRAKLGLKLIPEPEDDPIIESPSLPVNQKSSSELSVAETNKLRISLGLRPISEEHDQDEDNSTSVSAKKEIKHAEEESEQVTAQERIRQRIQESKLRTARKRKLQDADEIFDKEVESTDSWLQKLGKSKSRGNGKPKVLVASGLEDAVNQLDGITVDHTSEELQSLSDNAILTLDDVDVLNGEESGLTNELLSKRRRLKNDLSEREKADNIKHFGRHYRQFDDIESENQTTDMSKGENHTVIAGSVINISSSDSKSSDKEKPLLKRKEVSISQLFEDDEDVSTLSKAPSDYSKSKVTKIKKIKKKSSANSRSKGEASINTPMRVVKLDDDDQIDDDLDLEVQAVLAQKRRLKQREQRKNLTPEEIANEISTLRNQGDRGFEEYTIPEGGLVFDDVTDFVDNLQGNILDDDKGKETLVSSVTVDGEKDAKMIARDAQDEINSKEVENDDNHSDQDNATDSGPTFNGLGSTLKFLQSQNILQKNSKEDLLQARKMRERKRDAEVLKFNISVEERILREELSSDKTFMNTSKVEREDLFQLYLDQRLREKGIVKDEPKNTMNRGKYSSYNSTKPTSSTSSSLSHYNPQVKLSYKDDDGNELTTKQAYKVLSHKFHGVGPSAGKASKPSRKGDNKPSTSATQILH